MKAKALELRDCGTFIAVLAVDMCAENRGQRLLLNRCGFLDDGKPNIILTALDGHGKATNDPYEWNCRTWAVAHEYIILNWNLIEDGAVIDVQFILGETTSPKTSEMDVPPIC